MEWRLEVPEGVRLVIGRRLEQLSDKARRALASASVLGGVFSLELLEALGEVKGESLLDAVEEAEKAQVITSTPSTREARYIFTHELIRQTIVSGLSLPRRQRLHLRVAEAMEHVYPFTLEHLAADLAHHLYQAGAAADPEKTVHHLTLAGEKAVEVSAFEDAQTHFDHALSLLEVGDKRERADLLFKRGRAFRSLGRAEETLANWEKALSLNEELGDAEATARICWDMSQCLFTQAREREAMEIARCGLNALGDEVSADRCRLLASTGLNLGLSGDYPSGASTLRQSEALAESLNDRHLLGEVLSYEAILFWTHMKTRKQVDVGRRAIDVLRSAGDLWELTMALGSHQMGLIRLGCLEEAARIGEELETLATRLGNQHAHHQAEIGRGFREVMLTADVDGYETFAKRVVEVYPRTGPFSSLGNLFLGQTRFWKGRWEEALENFQEACEGSGWGVEADFSRGNLFLLKAYMGDKYALTLMHQKRVDLPRPGEAAPGGSSGLLGSAVEGLSVLGECEEAAKLYPLVLEAIDTGTVTSGPFALLERRAGIAAAAGEQWEKADQHYQIALRQAHDIPHRIEQPEVRRWYARMLIDRVAPGDRDKARQLLHEAIETYREIGMSKHVEMAEELIGRL